MKKVSAAAHTLEDTRFVDLVKEAGARQFCSLHSRDFILLFSQQLLPFRIRLHNFVYSHHLVLLGNVNLDGCNGYTSYRISQIYKIINGTAIIRINQLLSGITCNQLADLWAHGLVQGFHINIFVNIIEHLRNHRQFTSKYIIWPPG